MAHSAAALPPLEQLCAERLAAVEAGGSADRRGAAPASFPGHLSLVDRLVSRSTAGMLVELRRTLAHESPSPGGALEPPSVVNDCVAAGADAVAIWAEPR